MQTLKYFGSHAYNNPANCERNVELPLGFDFINTHSNVIELGEVTPFYTAPNHPVYDLRNETGKTLVQDAGSIDYTGKSVLSISTIEHIQTKDYGHAVTSYSAMDIVRRIINDADAYLLIWPVGYNQTLDAELQVSGILYSVIERVSASEWKQTDNKDLGSYKYNAPHYAGNAIVVISDERKQYEFE